MDAYWRTRIPSHIVSSVEGARYNNGRLQYQCEFEASNEVRWVYERDLHNIGLLAKKIFDAHREHDNALDLYFESAGDLRDAQDDVKRLSVERDDMKNTIDKLREEMLLLVSEKKNLHEEIQRLKDDFSVPATPLIDLTCQEDIQMMEQEHSSSSGSIPMLDAPVSSSSSSISGCGCGSCPVSPFNSSPTY